MDHLFARLQLLMKSEGDLVFLMKTLQNQEKGVKILHYYRNTDFSISMKHFCKVYDRRMKELRHGEGIQVKYQLFFTTIDGKVAQVITDTPSSSTCTICGATPRQMNDLEKVTVRLEDENAYQYGLSTLHAWIRFNGASINSIDRSSENFYMQIPYDHGYKKEKNLIILTVCTVISFIFYQLYCFLMITSETNAGNKLIPIINHASLTDLHLRTEEDKYINDNGIIRGVYYLSMPRYRPDSNVFKCLNSEQRIPYEQLNDDFCDCVDGTDEPSTNACDNGTFYCDTQYQGKPTSLNKIPSGKVNDGICDCCDGSDEWIHSKDQKLLSQSNSRHYRKYVSKCLNTC
ncbi:uncharacterized protein ACR2FA_009749 [Aphomia sociella]